MNKKRIISVLAVGVVLVLVTIMLFGQADSSSEASHKTPMPAGNEDVVSVDVKYVDGVVHLLVGKQQDDRQSLWYQASHDQGITWSQATHITSTHPIKFKRGNDARLAVQGDNIVVVWMSKVEGAPHNAGPMMAMRSTDNGNTWREAAMPADWKGSHGFFAMSANDDVINLVWLDSRQQKIKGSQGLRFSQTRDGGLSWSPNLTLDDLTCACCWNTSIFDNEGMFYVLYRDKQPSDMAIGRVDPQLNWQRLASVGQFNWDFEGCPHIGGGLTIDQTTQRLHATVSTGQTDKIGLYYLNSDNKGQTWSVPLQFGDSTAVHSDIAISNDGELVAVWDQLSEHGLQIVYALSLDHGQTWSEQQQLSKPEFSASHPKIIAMESGLLVLWTEMTDAGQSDLHKIILPSHE